MAIKNWYKLKGFVISLVIFLLLNAYLIYILSRYVGDKSTMTLFILLSNEMFLFIGILFFLYYKLKIEMERRFEIMEYVLRKRK